MPSIAIASPDVRVIETSAPSEEQIAPITGIPSVRTRDESSYHKLSGSAWLFWRRDSNSLAGGTTAPTLGGSQTGLRLSAPVLHPNDAMIAATLRFSSPLETRRGKDVSVGTEVRPFSGNPFRIFLERRIALDSGSKGGWSAILTHGVERPIARGKLKLIGYAEAGAVIRQKTDPFAFATVQVVRAISPRFNLGIKSTGDVQPGANRVDVGPSLSLKLSSQPAMTLSADWRFRIEGNAKPVSGPSVTMATSF